MTTPIKNNEYKILQIIPNSARIGGVRYYHEYEEKDGDYVLTGKVKIEWVEAACLALVEDEQFKDQYIIPYQISFEGSSEPIEILKDNCIGVMTEDVFEKNKDIYMRDALKSIEREKKK